MKKLLAVILMLCLVLPLAPQGARAEQFVENIASAFGIENGEMAAEWEYMASEEDIVDAPLRDMGSAVARRAAVHPAAALAGV